MSPLAVTRGIHQIGLTVPDLDRTRAFFLVTPAAWHPFRKIDRHGFAHLAHHIERNFRMCFSPRVIFETFDYH